MGRWKPVRSSRLKDSLVALSEVPASGTLLSVGGRDSFGPEFRALIEQSADAMAVQTDGCLSYVNPALVSYLGYAGVSDLLGVPVLELFQPSERPAMRQRLAQVLCSGEPSEVLEHALLRADGQLVTAQVAIAPVPFAGSPSVLITARDLTERRRMQAQLRAADRMATVGTLTASIMHEINNPLSALLGNLELLQSGTAPGEIFTETDAELLGDARDAAARIRHIVHDLRSFTHAGEEKRKPLPVCRVLDAALKLAASELRDRATVERDYRESLLVDANEVRLGQVFVNVLVNAAQAFPERDAQNRILIRTREQSGRVVVEITDNGAGIAPAVLQRIFDPLFTTKPIGVGTGLGLSICREIVGALGGSIHAASELGCGTTITIALPASAAREAGARSIRPTLAPARRATVLVIDDDPMVRKVFRRMLEGRHSVTLASSALEALELIERGAAFDAVFCDLTMPEMDGMEFHACLRELSPELAGTVTFMSGGVFTPEARAFVDALAERHLQKPFEIAQVLAIIER